MQVEEEKGFPCHFSIFYIPLPTSFVAEEEVEPEFSGSCWVAARRRASKPRLVWVWVWTTVAAPQWRMNRLLLSTRSLAFTWAVAEFALSSGSRCLSGQRGWALVCCCIGIDPRRIGGLTVRVLVMSYTGGRGWKGMAVICYEALIRNHKRYFNFLIFWFIIIESA